MKRFIFCVLLWSSLLFSSLTFAEEPILVIDPHGHSSTIRDIMFTPDGKTLISVSEDKTIRLWDVETGDLVKTLRHQIGEGHEGTIHGAALSPDGKILAIGGWPYGSGEHGNPVYLFDLENGEIIGLLNGHPDVVMALDFSQDGKWLASGSSSTIRIWDMSNLGRAPVIIIESEDGVFDLTFSPDGKTLVSGHIDHVVRLWGLSKNLEKTQQSGTQTLNTPEKILKKHTNVASCVAYSPDGKYIVSGDFDGYHFLWDTKKGKVKKKFGPMATGSAVAFSADSEHVMIANGDTVEIYFVPKGKKKTTFTKHASPVQTNAFSRSVSAVAFYGNDLVATAGGINYDIYIWNARTGDVKTHIAGKGKRVEAVAFGEKLHIAFGNTPGGLYNKPGPLERSFDFAEMVLNQKTPDENNFRRTQTEYEGKTLQYTPGHKNPEDWYTLKVKGAGTIKNEPKHGWVRAYTFTPNGDVVVGSSHALRLHRSDGEFIRDFVGHTGEIWAVSISRDGRILASASDDQTIRLWNLETAECLATLFIARDREWVCWTPQGYYTASAGGEKYIGWQLNQGMDKAAKFHPVSVFHKRSHQPELVKSTIALGNFEKALAAFKLEEIKVTQVLPPKIQWISPKEPAVETSQPSLRIQAEIQSDSELTAVKVLVNGRTQATQRGLMVEQEENALDNIIDQEIPLTPGRNEIAIFAANKDAGAPSELRIVLYEAEELKPDLYLVSIGISNYQRGDLQLTYADDDAKAISQVFRGQEGRLYGHVIIKELYDQGATQDEIVKAIEWLKTQATQKDVAVVFIASHGINDQGKYYLLPADGNPDELERTGVSWGDFSESLGNLPSRVLLFVDTCHSGQLGQDVYTLRQQVDNTEAIRKLSSDEYGVIILAASTGKEFSLEHPTWKHGAFTKALIEAMEEGQADYSGDGIILLRELDLYIAERVDALTQGEQHPTTQKPSTISRFPIVQVK